LGEQRLSELRSCPPIRVVGGSAQTKAEVRAAIRRGWEACGFHFGGHPRREVALWAFYAEEIPVPKRRLGGVSYRPRGFCRYNEREAFVFLEVPLGETYPPALAHEIAHAIAGGDRLCGQSRHLSPIYAKADALDRVLSAGSGRAR